MLKSIRPLAFVAACLLALGCSSCGTALPAEPRFQSPFAQTYDQEALRLQYLALSVVEVQAARPVVMKAPGKVVMTVQQGVGTGWVVATDRGRTLVMTNEHVCTLGGDDDEDAQAVEPPPQPAEAVVVMQGPILTRVLDVAGQIHPAAVAFADPATDVCLLSVEGLAGVPARLAVSDPPFGGLVERLGDDQGILNRGVQVYSSGRWSGRTKAAPDKHERSVVSLIASHGASGSPIFYRGEVVGMVEAIPNNPLGAFTWVVTLDDVRAAIAKVRPEWLKK